MTSRSHKTVIYHSHLYGQFLVVSGHPSDFIFIQEQLNNWDEAHLMMCHWYIEMDSNCSPHHEEEHRKSVEPTYIRPQPAVVVEAPGKRRGSKPKTATGKTVAGKEPASKELPTKNPSTKTPARMVPAADAHTKANDRPASLHFATPNVADGGAAIDKGRPIRRMDPPSGKAFDQIE